jgi:oxygen-independent coproporphyrinogen-3 oxidase
MEALLNEINALSADNELYAEKHLSTVYFGGGTPSLLDPAWLDRILNALHRFFDVSPRAEITLEANPDDITPARLNAWRNLGINRLSVGIQSFNDQHLIWMNRAHNAAQALACISMIREAGFSNFSIDLIYGLPQSQHPEWISNLEECIALQIPHISCYALTVEPKTALDHFVKKGKTKPVNEDFQREQFMLMRKYLLKAGYQHYEISNLCLPDAESRHNSQYWSGIPYYGFGPSAHSFNGQNIRWWNAANNALYIAARGVNTAEQEVLTPIQQMNETIMTGLRTKNGIHLHAAARKLGRWVYPEAQWPACLREIEISITNGLMELKEDRLVLTEEGMLFADGLAARLFAVAP